MSTCSCACHTNPYTPCTEPGGCGHLHRNDRPIADPVAALGGEPIRREPDQPRRAIPRVPAVEDGQPTPHRCRRGERCSGQDHADLRKRGALILAEDGLCLPCTGQATTGISELPRDYVDLGQGLQRGSAGMAELVAASKELPAPLRVNLAALASELVRVATTWAEPVAERLNIDWDSRLMDRHARPGYALQRATRLLTTNMSVLLAVRDFEVLVWADDGRYHRAEPCDGIAAALELLDLHHLVRSALGLTRLTHRLPAPCPRCENLTLIRDNGKDDVHCQRCGISWPYEDYQRLTLILAADIQRTA